jgi:hypothetical protein
MLPGRVPNSGAGGKGHGLTQLTATRRMKIKQAQPGFLKKSSFHPLADVVDAAGFTPVL